MIKKNIPNMITLANMLCGILSVLMCLNDKLLAASFFILLGIFFDFFDGYFARLLKVGGDFGKELDSLADVVTSGIAPGFIMFQLIIFAQNGSWFGELNASSENWQSFAENRYYFLPYLGFIIPLASAMRLAKFNIDERQTDSFIGLATPALSLLVASIPLIYHYSEQMYFVRFFQSPITLVVITLIGAVLMNSELPMFSLKFKNYGWKTNQTKYIFLVVSIFLVATLQFVAIPIIIAIYILFSVLENSTKKTPIKRPE
ncbi:CDP-alcohol phosphatidyltransferase family protein [Namhaeicola litoreus]|uniref:CDP-alcohol phosphatidyltransferase family protein n=1 Tax=Namhaeicola litoreus TaxID=1052145 RepID=A0ABW3Y6M6_9FLAO